MVGKPSYDRLLEDYDRLLEENKDLKEENKFLKKLILELQEKIEEKFNPSFVKPNKKKRSRKMGRKSGFKGTSRKIPKEIDEEIVLDLDKCPDCNSQLSEKAVEVKERYVEDIQPPKRHVKKYLIKRKWCIKCEKIVYKQPDDVLPNCRFGIFFMIFITYLKYGLRLPYNKISEFLGKFYGIKVSEAGLSNSIQIMSGYFGLRYEELKKELRKQKKVNIDETGLRVNGKNHWLWDFIAENVALFKISDSRGSKVPKRVLGKNFNGIIGSDFWSAYSPLNWKKQKCLVHLLRDIKKLKEKKKVTEEEKIFCRKLKRIIKYAVNLRKKNIPVEVGRWRKELLIKRVEKLSLKIYQSGDCRRLSERIFRHKEELFTFLDNPEIDWNNNAAERGLRPSVVIRKISGGNRSKKGTRAHEVHMTIMETCKLRRIDYTDYSMNYLQSQLTKA